ncbi:MAG: rubredoxin-like domain-containing protein [archaeon]
MPKKYFRCKICNDIHYGEAGPEICPTCQQKNAYEGIAPDDAKERMGL